MSFDRFRRTSGRSSPWVAGGVGPSPCTVCSCQPTIRSSTIIPPRISSPFTEMSAMPYQVNQTEVNAIAAGLAEYYTDAWQTGIKSVVANMGRSQMGLVSKYVDVAKDSYANLKKSSGDSFRVTFKSDLKQQISLFFANKYDVAQALVGVGEKIVDKVSGMIPIPQLGSALNSVADFAAGKAKEALHDRSVTEADKMLAAQSDAELQKMFANDKDTITFIENSMKQYKTLTNYIATLPTNVTSFDDAITFPKSAFRVQQAASSLNVSLWSIRQYCAAMQERLVECQKYVGAIHRDGSREDAFDRDDGAEGRVWRSQQQGENRRLGEQVLGATTSAAGRDEARRWRRDVTRRGGCTRSRARLLRRREHGADSDLDAENAAAIEEVKTG